MKKLLEIIGIIIGLGILYLKVSDYIGDLHMNIQ